jgi:DNA-binding CsgD family transcriptional regulator
MALTSRDETDLLLPLFREPGTRASFVTFLERLRRRTGARRAELLIRTAPQETEHDIFVGVDLGEAAGKIRSDGLRLIDHLQRERLRPGRVYGGDEFAAHDPALRAARALAMRQLGLADDRVVRVFEGEPASAWLHIASDTACTAADSALLSSLVPYLAGAIHLFVEVEQAKLVATLDASGLERAGSGWIAFDRAGRVQGIAPAASQSLEAIFGHAPRLGHRPREFGSAVERELAQAAAHFATDPDAVPRALVLAENPRVEAILTGLNHVSGAVMVARCRLPRSWPDRSAEHFARIHALPRREAQLAMLVAEGRSLVEAGQALGLTIETTRNYSKRLFAKLGVRGQAELVRVVYESCALLA